MSKRLVIAGVLWVVGTVLALRVDPILGASVGIFGAAVVVVVGLSANWDDHPSFEERELTRSRKRAARKERNWEENKDKRERDRVRYAAHQAKKAAKEPAAPRPTDRLDAERPAS